MSLRRRREFGQLLGSIPLGDLEAAEAALLAVVAQTGDRAGLQHELAHLLELHVVDEADLDRGVELPLGEARAHDAHGAVGRGVHRATLVDDPGLGALVLEGEELLADLQEARNHGHLGVADHALGLELHEAAGIDQRREEAFGGDAELTVGAMVADQVGAVLVAHLLGVRLGELAGPAGKLVERLGREGVLQHRHRARETELDDDDLAGRGGIGVSG